MKRVIILVFIILVFRAGSFCNKPLSADRWLEIDLYWFDKMDMQKSADVFWNRFAPLVEGINGWKGVILNVGWISDYILEWQGDLNQEIKLPGNMKQNPLFKDEGQLVGTTPDAMALWKNRFINAGNFAVINYDKWSYKDLKTLVTTLKDVARKKYKINDIKVGTLVLGWESIYSGNKSVFGEIHPEAFLNNAPNLVARLSADSKTYGAYPSGILQNTAFTEFFGKQWGNLSKETGLDVIILRDSYLGVGVYARRGPFGQKASADPAKVAAWSMATADLVKQTKISNPGALVIGYSSAASAVADWRVNCFDLETISKEGYLDGWIDQTWAGAWNEVGQRQDVFWNQPLLGWTYQLAYMLVHAAVLADSKVHHYFLTETFDAWESWDIIHNARERLRWGIWAYSHAAVKKPSGLKMPSGNYISWCNQGKRLLSEEDVRFIAETSNEAINDANNTKKIFGPTLVYCRSAMEWQSNHKPAESVKEWIDEQAGTLMKWSVPVLSITRSEYLPDIESDMFIFQTPVRLQPTEKENTLNILKSGKPVAVFGSPAGGLDKEISDIIGINTTDTMINEIKYIGTLNYKTDGIWNSLPNTFPVFQPYTKNKFKSSAEIVYSVSGSPCLGLNQSDGKQLIFWDPPEFSNNLTAGSDDYDESLDQILGSPTPYVITSRLINELMKKSNLINVDEISQYQPVNLAIWQSVDGKVEIMAGNLEEGINHCADKRVHSVINLPSLITDKGSFEINEKWSGAKIISGDKKLNIDLDQGQTKLFIIGDKMNSQHD
jgi:hypothetical protein